MKKSISVHISHFYLQGRIIFLKKMIHDYMRLYAEIDIFIHTNVKQLPIKNNKKVKVIYHDISQEHPHYLTWKHRDMLKRQLNSYDYYIYTEDDILFNRNNFKYYLAHHEMCKKNGYYLGFIRKETNGKDWYATDIVPEWGIFPISKKIKVENKNFYINENNPYSGFWIADNDELKKFCEHEYFDLNKCPYNGGYLREKSAWGFIPSYKGSLIIRDTKGAFVHHMPNNYVGDSLLARIKIRDIFS